MTAIEKDVCIQGSPIEGPWEDTMGGVRAGKPQSQSEGRKSLSVGKLRSFIVKVTIKKCLPIPVILLFFQFIVLLFVPLFLNSIRGLLIFLVLHDDGFPPSSLLFICFSYETRSFLFSH